MFKKALIIFILFSSIAYSQEMHVSPKLKSAVERIQQLPEAQELIDRVLEEGDLHIVINRSFSNKFEGYWDSYNRKIHITDGASNSALYSTILFELHNALRESDFENVDNMARWGKLNKKGYIEAMEYIEYENAKSTSDILSKGIKQGLYPANSYWGVSDTFEEHLRIQKRAGHSAVFAKMYEQL